MRQVALVIEPGAALQGAVTPVALNLHMHHSRRISVCPWVKKYPPPWWMVSSSSSWMTLLVFDIKIRYCFQSSGLGLSVRCMQTTPSLYCFP